MDEDQIYAAAVAAGEKWAARDEREKIAAGRNQNEMSDLLDLVNNLLKKYAINDTISAKHIRFFGDYIGNITLPVKDTKLSDLVFNKYFPPPNLKSYFHFTTLAAAEDIITNKRLRLSNLLKRFDDGEFRTFYDEHGMDGYKANEVVMGIDTSEQAIMKEIYFLSLTGSGSDQGDSSKWVDFGDDGRGVRLEFEIMPKHDDFREVYYSLHRNANSIPLLKDLFTEIKEKYDIPFNFSYSSKIGAFYIRGNFENEQEYRFLIKRTADNYDAWGVPPITINAQKKTAFIELPFSNSFAEFKLISIQPGYRCRTRDIEKIQMAVNASDSSVQIIPRAKR